MGGGGEPRQWGGWGSGEGAHAGLMLAWACTHRGSACREAYACMRRAGQAAISWLVDWPVGWLVGWVGWPVDSAEHTSLCQRKILKAPFASACA